MQRVLTMIKMLTQQKDFLVQFKIKYIMQFMESQLLKLFIIERIAKKNIWDFKHGKGHQIVKFINMM